MVYTVAQEFWAHISQRALESLSIEMWQYAKSRQQCKRLSQHNTKAATNVHPSILETDSSLNQGKNFSKKKKINK